MLNTEKWYGDHDEDTHALLQEYGYYEDDDYCHFLECMPEDNAHLPDNKLGKLRMMNDFLSGEDGKGKLRVVDIADDGGDCYKWKFVEYASPLGRKFWNVGK